MFNIKVYENDNSTLKQTINVSKLSDVGDFGAEINNGYATNSITLAYKISDTSIGVSDFIHIQYKKTVIYVGSVTNVTKTYTTNTEFVVIDMVGIGGLLDLLHMTGTYTGESSQMVKDIVDAYNVEYGDDILSYTAASIPDSGDNLNVTIVDSSTYLSALTDISEISGLSFFIDNDGLVTYKTADNFPSHSLTVGTDVSEVAINEDGTEIINSVLVEYSGGSKTYSDATSISTYKKREEIINKSGELNNIGTADVFGNNYIAENKGVTKKISVTVNNKYDYFSIKPGDTVSVLNIDYTITDSQVKQVEYGLEEAVLELEKYNSFTKEIFNNI